jgi:hypothetical protein
VKQLVAESNVALHPKSQRRSSYLLSCSLKLEKYITMHKLIVEFIKKKTFMQVVGFIVAQHILSGMQLQ